MWILWISSPTKICDNFDVFQSSMIFSPRSWKAIRLMILNATRRGMILRIRFIVRLNHDVSRHPSSCLQIKNLYSVPFFRNEEDKGDGPWDSTSFHSCLSVYAGRIQASSETLTICCTTRTPIRAKLSIYTVRETHTKRQYYRRDVVKSHDRLTTDARCSYSSIEHVTRRKSRPPYSTKESWRHQSVADRWEEPSDSRNTDTYSCCALANPVIARRRIYRLNDWSTDGAERQRRDEKIVVHMYHDVLGFHTRRPGCVSYKNVFPITGLSKEYAILSVRHPTDRSDYHVAAWEYLLSY